MAKRYFDRPTGGAYVHCNCLLPGTHGSEHRLFEPGIMDYFICCLAGQTVVPERRIAYSVGQGPAARRVNPSGSLYPLDLLIVLVCPYTVEQDLLHQGVGSKIFRPVNFHPLINKRLADLGEVSPKPGVSSGKQKTGKAPLPQRPFPSIAAKDLPAKDC